MEKMRKNVYSSPISTILITVSQIWYVCVGLHLLSSPNILLKWLPWQLLTWHCATLKYTGNIYKKT